jgi:hypothetical protein
LSFAISGAEQGGSDHAATGAEHQIEEEIEEIKRYEVRIYKSDPLNIFRMLT